VIVLLQIPADVFSRFRQAATLRSPDFLFPQAAMEPFDVAVTFQVRGYRYSQRLRSRAFSRCYGLHDRVWVLFQATNASMGASTVNVNSLGTENILKNGTTALAAIDILAGQIAEVIYDGPAFRMPSQSCSAVSGLSTSLTNSHFYVGNGSGVATDTVVSGDLSLANTRLLPSLQTPSKLLEVRWYLPVEHALWK
jgi:hypothetical protein